MVYRPAFNYHGKVKLGFEFHQNATDCLPMAIQCHLELTVLSRPDAAFLFLLHNGTRNNKLKMTNLSRRADSVTRMVTYAVDQNTFEAPVYRDLRIVLGAFDPDFNDRLHPRLVQNPKSGLAIIDQVTQFRLADRKPSCPKTVEHAFVQRHQKEIVARTLANEQNYFTQRYYVTNFAKFIQFSPSFQKRLAAFSCADKPRESHPRIVSLLVLAFTSLCHNLIPAEQSFLSSRRAVHFHGRFPPSCSILAEERLNCRSKD